METSLKPVKYGWGRNPNSLKNLKPFPKGVNGNHNGYSLTSELKHSLNEESEFISPTARPKDKLWRQQIVRTILAESAKGNVPMVKELLDRVDGKVLEKHAILGDIIIEVVRRDRRLTGGEDAV